MDRDQPSPVVLLPHSTAHSKLSSSANWTSSRDLNLLSVLLKVGQVRVVASLSPLELLSRSNDSMATITSLSPELLLNVMDQSFEPDCTDLRSPNSTFASLRAFAPVSRSWTAPAQLLL